MMKQVENFNPGIYGKEPLFEVREISTLKDMFESSTEIYAERTGFLVKDDPKAPYKEIKYKQFREDVYAFATGLIDMGLQGKKIAVINTKELILLVSGGVAYTLGLIFYKNKTVKYMHFIWHIFVLAGSILQYFFILSYYMR